MSAEFYDENSDGVYNPCDGDIPALLFQSCTSNNYENPYTNLPAQVSYYLMNDNAWFHSVTGGSAMQLQIGVYTFSFKSPGTENIIFNKYTIVNNATDDIRDFYLGKWFDFDLGCPQDDFIGTDEDSRMLFAYNAGDTDNCVEASLSSPLPMIGTTCLRGFAVYKNKEYDENGNLILVDPPYGSVNADTLESTVVSNIIIPNNCEGNEPLSICNPQTDTEFYYTLTGQNLDGTQLLDEMGNQVDFMFEGNPSDPNSQALCNTDSKVIETTATMSVGSGTFQPGTKGVIVTTTFVTNNAEYPCPDLKALKYKESIAQKLYDNCFFNYLTPPPPTIVANNSNSEVNLSLSSIPYDYKEYLPYYLVNGFDTYNFEGIKIYQVASQNFDLTELNNPAYSRLVYQGDVTNDIVDIANYEATFDGPNIDFVPVNKAVGANEGIVSQITLDKDYLTDSPIQSGKEYFYVAVSYVYNNYKDFDPETRVGQQYPYLETNCGIKVVSSNMTSSNHKTPYAAGLYEFEFNNNRIKLSNTQEDLDVHLIATDGKIIQKLSVSKSNDFESDSIFGNLPNGLYFIHVSAKESGLHGSHKILVMK